MENLKCIEDDNMLRKILSPMLQLLDEKNITKGIDIKKENGKVYICLDRNCLSYSNQLILEKISHIYSKNIFYSDDIQSPNNDRLEYWDPFEQYDKKQSIREKCRNKKMFVLELDYSDEFTILGTSIMLANVLEEQDPLDLKINEDLTILEEDIFKRHQHYILSGYPDLRWIYLRISLDKNNPLRENPYASFLSICEINSPVFCDNLILSTIVGYKEKIYKSFCMDKEELEKAIREYFERQKVDRNYREQIEPVLTKKLTPKKETKKYSV